VFHPGHAAVCNVVTDARCNAARYPDFPGIQQASASLFSSVSSPLDLLALRERGADAGLMAALEAYKSDPFLQHEVLGALLRVKDMEGAVGRALEVVRGVKQGFQEAIASTGQLRACSLLCKRKLGFSLKPGASGVRGAGQGLFLEGQGQHGALLAFIPGVLFRSERDKSEPGSKAKAGGKRKGRAPRGVGEWRASLASSRQYGLRIRALARFQSECILTPPSSPVC
jgi:hypothetical protein